MADYTVPSTPVDPGTGASTPYPSATVYDLPNFVGNLYSLVPTQTPITSMMGGLSAGVKTTDSTEFTWQVEDNEAAAINNSKREGDDPTDSAIIRQTVKNVVEIHQESVNISYTKQGATGMVATAGETLANFQPLGDQPVSSEVTKQLNLKISKIARDVERSVLNGVYANPANNLTARQTRGVLTSISTHTAAYAVSIRTSLNAMLAGMYEDEMTVAPLVQPILVMNGTTKVKTSNEYSNNLGLADRSRVVGGVNVDSLVTDFGTFGIVLDRYMPVDQIALIDMSVMDLCFLEVDNRGVFFTEPLAKTGAYDRAQIYGEIGLEYGPEQFHGLITAIP